jgi:hypothetical protein
MPFLLGGFGAPWHLLLLCRLRCLLARHVVERKTHAGFILRMHLLEVPKLPLGDEIGDSPHRLGDVGEEPRLLILVEQIE